MKLYTKLLIALSATMMICQPTGAQVTLNFTVRFMAQDSNFGGATTAPLPTAFPFADGYDINGNPSGPTYNLAFTLNPSFTTSSTDGTWSGANILSSVSNAPGLPSSNWVGANTSFNVNPGASPGFTLAIANPNNRTSISTFSDGTEFIYLELSITGTTTFSEFITGQTPTTFFTNQQNGPYAGFDGSLIVMTNLFGFPQAIFNVESLQINVPGSAIPEPSTYAILLGSLALLAALIKRNRKQEVTATNNGARS